MTTTKLTHTDYTCPSGGLETPNGKGNEKTILAGYATLNHISMNGKVLTTALNNTRLNRVGYIFDTLE